MLAGVLLQTQGPATRGLEAWRKAAEIAKRLGDKAYQIRALLTDQFGPRRVVIVSAVTMAAGLFGISSFSTTFPMFAFTLIAASILGSPQSGVPYTQIIVRWFDGDEVWHWARL